MKCRCGKPLLEQDGVIYHEVDDCDVHAAFFAVAEHLRPKVGDVVEFMYGACIVFGRVERMEAWHCWARLDDLVRLSVDEVEVTCPG